ncbi:adenylate/guanylate cyclase domain-containing protein [Elstera litoralis]|uniref:adenylate/guanylate cyclase domain-containing protein n=1 Tax=Elstera litoralis TaxID=552518 RepID=UPI0006967AF6|nr:adenylate/guanylate cyclase domain-containing protein [Elstera litoralis]
MLLRTRVVLIVAAAFVLLTGGLVAASWQRERLVEDRRAEETFQTQSLLWSKIVERYEQDLRAALRSLAAPALADALAAGNHADVQQMVSVDIARLQAAKRIDQMEVVDTAGDVLLTTASGFPPPTLLDAGTINQVLSQAQPMALVQQDSSRRFRITAAHPLTSALGQVSGILAAAVDSDRALEELSAGLGGDAYILSLRNRVAHGTNQALAKELAFDLPIRQRYIEHRTVVGRHYQIASVPLLDTVGRVVGALVTVKDVTSTVGRVDRVGLVSGLLVGIGVILIVAFLIWYLRRSFGPLDDAITGLNALSRGDTSVQIYAPKNDEIGRIAAAVEVFRDHARTLDRYRDERERQRRRQERMIRRQMLALADTLDEEARREVLGDLEAIVRERRDSEAAHDPNRGDEDQLALLSSVLKQLCNRMLADIAERRKAEMIRETFGKYIDPRVVASLLVDPNIGGEQQVMTVSFADMQGFTNLSERLNPRELVTILNDYLTLMSRPIKDQHGIVDKYMGDAVMAFWGPPFTMDMSQASEACLAALEQREEVRAWVNQLVRSGRFTHEIEGIDIRCGIATGELIVGSIGSEQSRTYTVLGDTANLAARLETANKALGTRLLISGATRELAGARIETREMEEIVVMGKTEAVKVYELLAESGKLDEHTARLRDHFELGLRRYYRRDWQGAMAAFEECLTLRPNDQPSKRLLTRCTALRQAPPPDSWTGAWTLLEK